MFTVKVTYRGETRKLPCSVNTFPSFEQLCNQLYRVFPISHNYYFSKLLFSPNATQGGRILIGREVRSADDYNRIIGPYKDRSWPHALLRFAVYEETPHKIPSAITNGPANSNPWTSTYNAPNVIFTPVPPAPIPASHVPPPSMSYTASATSAMDIDNGTEDRKRKATSISTCCSAQSTKQEIQDLMMEFKEDLGRILETNFRNGPSVIPSPPLSFSRLTSDIAPNMESPQICSICAQSRPCPWFTCGRCHIVGCFGCSTKGLLCLGTAEHHQWNYTPKPVAASPSFMMQSPFFDHSRIDSSTILMTQTPRSEGTATPTVPFIPPPQASPAPSVLPDCNDPLARTVVHRGVRCDICENTIEGVRHKCLDCPDYDLCTGCITSGGAERHSPFHEFFEITEPGRVIVHTVNDGNTYAQRTARETATELVSHFATCDLCNSHIQGDRYKCLECPDFDTCSSCFRITEIQHPQHTFIRIRHQEDLINRRPRDKLVHSATCNICTRHIFGIRFKCMHPDCPDFDLCDICEAHPIPLHPESHALLKMRTPDAFIPANCVKSSVKLRGCEPSTDPVTVTDTLPDNVSCKGSLLPEGTRNTFVWGCMQAASASGELDPQMPSAEAVLTPLFTPRLDEISPSITPPASRARSQSTLSARPDKGIPSTAILQPQESDGVAKLECQSEYDKEIKTPSQQEIDPDRTSCGSTWPDPANDLAHLMQLVSLEPENPSILIPSQFSPVDSPLTGEALLTRPPEERVEEHVSSTDMQQKLSHPVSLTYRTLSMLLSGSRSPSTVQTSSSVTSLLLEEPKASSRAVTVEESKDLVGEKNDSMWDNVKELVRGQAAVSVEKEKAEIYYGATFIEDVTVPDGQVFPPGAEFMKCWRILNDSDYDWPEATELVYVAGENLGVEKGCAVPVGQVKARTEVDLWTGELKAPDIAGRYVSYWRLRDGEGRLFGGSIWIDVVVADALSDDSDRSIASSLVVMPRGAPERSEPSVRIEGKAPSTVVTLSMPSSSTDGIGSDAGSDISLVSTPSSDAVWEDVASSLGDRQSQTSDYILLYDDRSSEDE